MTMSLLDNAVHVVPVVYNGAADTTGKTGLIFRAATTAGSVARTIPADVRGCWVRMLVVGANTQYVITTTGVTAPTLAYNQLVTAGTGHTDAGGTIVDGFPEQFRLPDNAHQIVVISSGTSGFLEMSLAGRTGG